MRSLFKILPLLLLLTCAGRLAAQQGGNPTPKPPLPPQRPYQEPHPFFTPQQQEELRQAFANVQQQCLEAARQMAEAMKEITVEKEAFGARSQQMQEMAKSLQEIAKASLDKVSKGGKEAENSDHTHYWNDEREQPDDQDHPNELTRMVVKNYAVSSTELLDINSRYGLVHINVWDKPEIDVEVTVKAWGRTREQAQRLMDRIRITDSRTTGRVAFVTSLENGGYAGNNCGFEVNYQVNMPAHNPLTLSQHYGSVYLADFAGPLDLKVSYGSVRAGKIMTDGAHINLGYSTAQIDYLKNAQLSIGYGKCQLEDADQLSLQNSYSKFSAGRLGKLSLTAKYGEVTIDQVDQVDGSVSYTDFELARLEHKMQLEAKYVSDFTVNRIAAGFELIDLKNNFSTCVLNFSPTAACNFEMNFSYGDLELGPGANVSFSRKEKDHNRQTAYYVGRYGTGIKPGTLRVVSGYGDIRMGSSPR